MVRGEVQGPHDRRACGGKHMAGGGREVTAGESERRVISFFYRKAGNVFVFDLWVRKDTTKHEARFSPGVSPEDREKVRRDARLLSKPHALRKPRKPSGNDKLCLTCRSGIGAGIVWHIRSIQDTMIHSLVCIDYGYLS